MATDKSGQDAVKKKQDQADLEKMAREHADGEPFNWSDVRDDIGCGDTKAKRLLQLGAENGQWLKHQKMKKPRARNETWHYVVTTDV